MIDIDEVTSPQYFKMLTQARHTVTAPLQGVYEITRDIQDWAEANSLSAGLSGGGLSGWRNDGMVGLIGKRPSRSPYVPVGASGDTPTP